MRVREGKQEKHIKKGKPRMDTTPTGFIEVLTLLYMCFKPLICLETALKIGR